MPVKVDKGHGLWGFRRFQCLKLLSLRAQAVKAIQRAFNTSDAQFEPEAGAAFVQGFCFSLSLALSPSLLTFCSDLFSISQYLARSLFFFSLSLRLSISLPLSGWVRHVDASSGTIRSQRDSLQNNAEHFATKNKARATLQVGFRTRNWSKSQVGMSVINQNEPTRCGPEAWAPGTLGRRGACPGCCLQGLSNSEAACVVTPVRL